MTPPVTIVEYDPSWPYRFEVEQQRLVATLGAYMVRGIHHVGSIAVCNVSAKPIIDIMVGVRDLETTKPCAALDSCYAPHRPTHPGLPASMPT